MFKNNENLVHNSLMAYEYNNNENVFLMVIGLVENIH